MDFSDTTNLDGLIQDCEDRLGFDDAGISGDSNLLKRFTRRINTWYRRVDSWIWEADIFWQFDDTTYTNLPRATATLVDDQTDYEIPSTARRILKVFAKDNNGDWYKLQPIDKSAYNSPLEEIYETKGIPQKYDLEGDSIFIYPAPDSSDVTLSSGLKLHFSRDIDEFSSSDTTTEPGFDNHFHPILSIGASLDYALGYMTGDANRIDGLRAELESYKQELQSFYEDRMQENKTRINNRNSRRMHI